MESYRMKYMDPWSLSGENMRNMAKEAYSTESPRDSKLMTYKKTRAFRKISAQMDNHYIKLLT